MKPKPRPKMEYEKVKTDDWVLGIIEQVQYEENRNTGFKDEEGNDRLVDSVRFKFKLDGYSFPHYSSWMAFSYHEKAGLFLKYLTNLVEGAIPDMDFDLDALEGLVIKSMWVNKGDFQKVEMIRPKNSKIQANTKVKEKETLFD